MSYRVYVKTTDGDVYVIGRYDTKEEAEAEYHVAWQAMSNNSLFGADTPSSRRCLNGRYVMEVGMDDTDRITTEIKHIMDELEGSE